MEVLPSSQGVLSRLELFITHTREHSLYHQRVPSLVREQVHHALNNPSFLGTEFQPSQSPIGQVLPSIFSFDI